MTKAKLCWAFSFLVLSVALSWWAFPYFAPKYKHLKHRVDTKKRHFDGLGIPITIQYLNEASEEQFANGVLVSSVLSETNAVWKLEDLDSISKQIDWLRSFEDAGNVRFELDLSNFPDGIPLPEVSDLQRLAHLYHERGINVGSPTEIDTALECCDTIGDLRPFLLQGWLIEEKLTIVNLCHKQLDIVERSFELATVTQIETLLSDDIDGDLRGNRVSVRNFEFSGDGPYHSGSSLHA